MTPSHPAARSLAECVREAVHDLVAAGYAGADARIDADVIARHLLRWDTATWLSRQRENASLAFRATFVHAIERRRAHEPVAYITGIREFYGRPFVVSSSVLIPRPETELAVDEALAALTEIAARMRTPRVADVGTGSGCLAITLALECAAARITATDVSDTALAVAVENAARLGVEGRIAFRRTSLLGGAADAFDLVVSNPPYVPMADRHTLAPDVRDYEPATALFGGDDGLDVIRVLLPAAARALTPEGWLVMEIGAGQADALRALVHVTSEFTLVRISPDLAGIPRVVIARRSASV